jgi:hypothetical protein
MKLIEVITEKDKKDFLLLPLKIYKGDANWSRPLNKDIEEVFDPKKNKFFRHGKCTRFLLKDDEGNVIGRTAVFINEKTANKNDQPTGGMGFFECIEDQRAANLLFDQCKRWLMERGMEAMDGPVNFGERDSWWGLIVEGFNPTPYKMNYNKPYYQKLFESYGFKTYFEQWCYALTVHNQLQPKFHERHDKIAQDPDYHSEHIKKSMLEKYAEDFRIIYNKAWAKHGGGKELDSRQVMKLFSSMKPVIDENLIWYVYYKNEPVAMWVNLPDINQLFRKFNGRFTIMEKLRFILMLRRNRLKKFIGLVFGVVPSHQGKGIDSYLILQGAEHIRKKTPYLEFEMQWIGDFNPRMVSIAENLGTYKSRILKTYRYLFDPNKEFKRHPFL